MKLFSVVSVTFTVVATLFCSFLYPGNLRLAEQADQGRQGLYHLKKGMSSKEVSSIMGAPCKTLRKTYEDKTYDVWLYLTKVPDLYQKQLIPDNYTPVIFLDNILVGWGDKFYKYVFHIDDAYEEQLEEVRQRYTEDKDEWPSNQHGYIPPPQEAKEQTDKEPPIPIQNSNIYLTPAPANQNKSAPESVITTPSTKGGKSQKETPPPTPEQSSIPGNQPPKQVAPPKQTPTPASVTTPNQPPPSTGTTSSPVPTKK